MSSLDAYHELVKENPDSIHPILDSPQEQFVRSTVREVGYGGEAGGAKSYGLILCPLYQLHKKDYHAILFRRTYKQLAGDDGLIDLSKKVYPSIGGHYIKSEYKWEFSGYPGTIRFAHLEHESLLEQLYEGHQYAFVGFDELQTFTKKMYLYLFSRNRCTNPEVSLYTRSTFMPGEIGHGGVGHIFVKRRFIIPFRDDNGWYTLKSKRFININSVDTEVSADNINSIERLFIPAKLEDNPYLWRGGDSDYERGLRQLDAVDYARKKGDWDIRRTGRVYHAFSDSNIGPDSRDLDLSQVAGYYHSHDFGAVNHVWGLWAKIGDKYYLVHEEQLPEGTTAARAARIKRKFGDKQIVTGWGGAAGESQYRLDFGKEGVIIRLPYNPKSVNQDQLVETQIRKANKMFADGTLIVCSDMVMTLDQLENCVRDEDEKIADKASWHYLDGCVRYFAAGIGRGVFVG